ncbi:MAG: nucleotide-binding protein [Candidatus Pristimantibacillus sp.]
MAKPKLFIGSSMEAIKYTNAIHRSLSYYAEVTPWHAGTFKANDYAIEALERQLQASDFAVFVLAADDIVEMRGKTYLVPRDNAVFEMGMFWGKLRRGRVFFLIPEYASKERNGQSIDEFHLPSDLLGMTVLRYENRTDDNYDAAVNLACDDINDRIKALGKFPDLVQQLQLYEAELKQRHNLLHFFIEFNKKAFIPHNQYERMYEAIRIAYDTSALDGYRVTGAAIWQAGLDGMTQIAGNVGKGRYFPYHSNEGKDDGESKILVVDTYLNSTMRFLKLGKHIAAGYLLCYPVGKEFVITVHLAGARAASEEDLTRLAELNSELMDMINYLLGGDSH